MFTSEQCVERIRASYPTLAIGRARIEEAGQNNLVLMVNDALVFRFPRYAAGARALRMETALLRALRGRLPLPIPDPLYAHLASDLPGEAFMGYPLIAGEPLWRETLAALDDEAATQAMAEQVGAFLRALHHVPVGETELAGQPVADGAADWADLYARFRERLFAHMRPDARDAVARDFAAFLGEPSNFAYAPALRHGDFGPSNILWDAARRRITGVIDFGGAGLGDPAVDVAGIICEVGYGEAFARRCLHIYPEVKGMLARARFYVSTFALQEALFGVEQGD